MSTSQMTISRRFDPTTNAPVPWHLSCMAASSMNFHGLYDWINLHLGYPSQIGVLILAINYIVLVIGVRWQMIAQPIRNGIETRLRLLDLDARHAREKSTYGPIAAEIAEKALNECKRWGLLEIVFWSRGKETSLWQRIDKAESYLVYGWPPEKLLVRAIAVNARLENMPTNSEAQQLRGRISARIVRLENLLANPDARRQGTANSASSAPDELEASTEGALPSSEFEELIRELAELYREAVRVDRTSLVNDDVELDHFNNKILWHIMISLAAIVFIANIAPAIATSMLLPPGEIEASSMDELRFRHAFILMLLSGAIGGILSRLTSALRAARSPSERGASWMAMFMSPLAGALAGWAGCLLIVAAHQLKLIIPNLDGSQFRALLVGASVLFGFSERLFIGIADKIEGQMLPDRGARAGTGTSEAPQP